MRLGDIKKEKNVIIRQIFDEKIGSFQFSVVDVIDNLGLSTDPRNYWKVLKNRFKKEHNELVTKCNQLKMEANDGKKYLTDTADAHTLLQIIEILAPEKVSVFEKYFNEIENENSQLDSIVKEEETKFSTVSIEEGEIQIDVFKNNSFFFIQAMLAGINPENIFISANYKNVTIKSIRLKQETENYFLQELFWGKFERNINLPEEIDIDKIEAKIFHGLLTIRIPILNKDRVKIIKVSEK